MRELRIESVTDDALVLTADDGSEFRLRIDESLRARLRRTASDLSASRKLSPKEIQAQIRGGMSAADVARITGTAIEYIERFEGPVIAELEYVIDSALAVPVHTAGDDPLAATRTFGSAIIERLHEVDGTQEAWSSWKDATGWIVCLTFTAADVDRDARWQFDPRKRTLSPANAEAIRLSQQGAAPEPLVPRLRAVDSANDTPSARGGRPARFDSDAFHVDPISIADSGPVLAPIGVRSAPVEDAATNRTADLLEALRRRRGEREAAQFEDDAGDPSALLTDTLRAVDDTRDARGTAESDELTSNRQSRNTAPQPRVKKGRSAMPSWDEIVFGTRSDDDPA